MIKIYVAVLIVTLITLSIATFIFVPEWVDKIGLSIAASVCVVAALQLMSAKDSAAAAEISAQSAKDARGEALYIHLASIWYELKRKGLENSKLIDPGYTTLYHAEDANHDYRDYQIYAWMCWGHAEDCYEHKLHDKPGFLPSLKSYKELHQVWLNERRNREMFDEDFLAWVENDLVPLAVTPKKIPLLSTGVFATRDFKAGEFIGLFAGDEYDTPSQMSVQFGPNLHVEPETDLPLRYLNHSCVPNAFFRGRNLYAMERIHEGDEIVFDYNATEYELDEPFECRCDKPGCVRQVKGWKFLSEDQKADRRKITAEWITELPAEASMESAEVNPASAVIETGVSK